MDYRIGNVELQPFPSSEVIWLKEDLRLVGGSNSPNTIVRALKVGERPLFDDLGTLLRTADDHFKRVAALTGATVVRRYSFGIADTPKNGLSTYEKYVLHNPYIEAGRALVAKVDVIQKAGRISVLDMQSLQRGANTYLRQAGEGYYWGDLSKGEATAPPYAIHDQFTYGTAQNDTTPKIYLTDIDPIIFKEK